MTESPSALLERAAELVEQRVERDEAPLWLTMMPDDAAHPLAEWLHMAAKEYRSREPLPKVGEANPNGLPIDLTGAFGPSYWTLALDLAHLIAREET